MTKTTRTISFDTDRDADLLAYLDAQKNVSKAVRDALRSVMANRTPEITLEQVYQAIQDLENKIQVGTVAGQAEQAGADVAGTQEAASVLDSLGL